MTIIGFPCHIFIIDFFQLSQREEELQKLHTSSTKGIYQQNQIADRMRHYEAQGQLTEMLQKELHQAQVIKYFIFYLINLNVLILKLKFY